jgi:hypothetical protein
LRRSSNVDHVLSVRRLPAYCGGFQERFGDVLVIGDVVALEHRTVHERDLWDCIWV